jgi:hypothetical protein
MKKRMLARVEAEKAKRVRKRARRRSLRGAKDPKDLRGARGALLKAAADLEGDLSQAGDQRHPPLRISSDW